METQLSRAEKLDRLFGTPAFAVIIAILCNAMWGSAFPFIKLGYRLFAIDTADTASILCFAGVRFMLGSVLVLGGSLLLEGRLPAMPKGKILAECCALGLWQTTAQYAFFYSAVALLTGAFGGILNSTQSFLGVIFAHFLYGRADRMTPAKALGVTDQHSQLQLYNEGPFDKVITFIKVENFRTETKIPKGCEEFKDVAFLGGMTHNTLIEAERQGTEYALYVNRRMNQTIIMPEVNAYTLGQLMFLLEMTTAYEGELLNIDAFNQPGVETSKRATYAILGNTDAKYDAARKEMTGRPAFKPEYIL